MPFDNSRTLLGSSDGGLGEKAFCLGAIESRMHAGDVVERLRNPDPARQDGHIGNEGDVAHEPFALGPGIAAEHPELSLIGNEAEDRIERGGLAGAVGADQSEDAPFFDAQIDAVERDRRAERLAQTACFDAWHGLSAPPDLGYLSEFASVILRWSAWMAACHSRRVQQFFRRQAKALNGLVDPGPFFGEKFLALAFHQQIACARVDEHAASPFGFDQSLVYQLLVALEDRERIDPIFRRDGAHRGQGITLLEHAVENHRDHAVAKLAVNRLTVVPLTVHQVCPATLQSLIHLLCTVQVEVRMHRFVAGHHVGPVLDVMVRVDQRKHSMVHVSVFGAA